MNKKKNTDLKISYNMEGKEVIGSVQIKEIQPANKYG